MTQPNTSISGDSWREKEPTEKQLTAIFNMEYALGCETYRRPKTRGEACDLITKLKAVIHNNLSIGGSINPRHSVYEHGSGWDGFEEAF